MFMIKIGKALMLALTCILLWVCELFGPIDMLSYPHFPVGVLSRRVPKAFCSTQSDASGLKYFYQLPDGMEFTIWEKEPGVYGSDVLIIPGIHKRKTEPKNSYIRARFSTSDPTLYYLPKDRRRYKNTIIIQWPESDKKQDLFEIINKSGSDWNIMESNKSNKSNNYTISGKDYQLSFFTIDIDEHHVLYQLEKYSLIYEYYEIFTPFNRWQRIKYYFGLTFLYKDLKFLFY